jgi:hypothetical protein
MRAPARFSVDDREDSAARRAPLFHVAGTFQPPSAATDINGNEAMRTTAARRNGSLDLRSSA